MNRCFNIEFQMCAACLLRDILAETDGQYAGRNCLADRRGEIMARLTECGFQKELLLE